MPILNYSDVSFQTLSMIILQSDTTNYCYLYKNFIHNDICINLITFESIQTVSSTDVRCIHFNQISPTEFLNLLLTKLDSFYADIVYLNERNKIFVDGKS